jgi:hypothetical protein
MPKNRLVRFAIATGLAATAAIGVAQPATAQVPPTEPQPAGTACSFPLLIELTGGNLQQRSLTTARDGTVRTVTAGSTGTLTLTNVSTGESISFPSRGVGQRSVTSNGITTISTGGQLFLALFPSDVPPGPSSTLYTGRVVYTVDAEGVFTLQKTAGRQVDVCAELAGP